MSTTFKILVQDSDLSDPYFQEVQGAVLGHLGIHKAAPKDWRVTHLKTGLSVARNITSERGARRVAKEIGGRFWSRVTEGNKLKIVPKRIQSYLTSGAYNRVPNIKLWWQYQKKVRAKK